MVVVVRLMQNGGAASVSGRGGGSSGAVDVGVGGDLGGDHALPPPAERGDLLVARGAHNQTAGAKTRVLHYWTYAKFVERLRVLRAVHSHKAKFLRNDPLWDPWIEGRFELAQSRFDSARVGARVEARQEERCVLVAQRQHSCPPPLSGRRGVPTPPVFWKRIHERVVFLWEGVHTVWEGLWEGGGWLWQGREVTSIGAAELGGEVHKYAK